MYVGVGRVSFSALGSGFGSSSDQFFFIFQSILAVFGCIWQQISKISQKKLFRVTRVLEKIARVGLAKKASGRVKFRVGF